MLNRFLAVLGLALCFAVPATAQTVAVLPPMTNYMKPATPLVGFSAIFNVGAGVVEGRDWHVWQTYTPTTWPSGTTVDIKMPLTAAPSGVRGFAIVVGRNRMSGTQPLAPEPLVKLTDLTEVHLRYDMKYLGAAGSDFNALWDVFLYADEAAVKANAKSAEIEILPHLGADGYAYALAKPCIRKCSQVIDGRKWNMRQNGPISLFFPDQGVDYLTADIDLRPFLDVLQGSGLVKSDWLYAGSSFGPEFVKGSVTVQFPTLSLSSPTGAP